MHETRIAYFVHDINDPAVARRVTMLRAAGAELIVIGFRRGERVPDTVAGAAVVDLGGTHDGNLVQRARKVIANLLRPAPMLAAAAGAHVVMARNLESLALAVRVRRNVPHARLVYECLDIHRALLGRSLPARAVQHVERLLLRSIDLLVVSSPAFLRDYFDKRASLTARALVIENKLLALDGPPPAPRDPPAGPPWVIGWFGNLRCRRTFDELRALTQALPGRVEVLIAGRPSPAVFTDFAAMVARAPGCSFAGAYRPEDLPGLYARCRFAWGIDYFEEGLNSAWLLPNKLYEASSFGAVPVALRGVETGRWLARHGAGVLLNEADPAGELRSMLSHLDEGGYAALRSAVVAIPRTDLIADERDCAALLREVLGQ